MRLGCGIHFESSSTEGAVLVLPDGGLRKDLSVVTHTIVKRYAEKHALSWRDLAGGCNSLYLLTGVDKTASWGIASYSNASRDGRISLEFKVDPVMSGNMCYAHRWEVNNGADVRVGPKYSGPVQLRQQRGLVASLEQIGGGQGRQGSRDVLYSSPTQAQDGSRATRQPGSTQNGSRRRGRGQIPPPELETSQQSAPSDAVVEPNNQSSSQPQNQCIFVRGYMLSFRDDLIPLRNPIKVSSIGSNSEDPGSKSSGSWITNIVKRFFNPRSTDDNNTSAGQSSTSANRSREVSMGAEVVINSIPGTSEVSALGRCSGAFIEILSLAIPSVNHHEQVFI